MTFDELLDLPIRQFWFLNRQVDRLSAEDDLRQIALLASVGSQEGYEKITASLHKQVGEIVVFGPPANTHLSLDDGLDPEFDIAGLESLKARHTRPRT